jgi:serine/threonine protein kinase/DNA-binding response OmpR family regulator
MKVTPAAGAGRRGERLTGACVAVLDHAAVVDSSTPTLAGGYGAEDRSPVPYSDLAETWPQFGTYRVLRKLGEGGMGVVYEAEAGDGSIIALKILAVNYAARKSARERFLREARHAAQVRHPNVVTCLDAGDYRGHLYIAMELVTGGDLEQRWPEHGPLPPIDAVVRIGRDCAEGLAAIHALRLVHRDIKPSNIFLDVEGRAKIGDFGLAKEVGAQGMTRSGDTIGTPEFMPPEQARGEPTVDGRADIYALGATLFTVATGQMPYVGPTAWSVLTQVVSVPFPDPLSFRPDMGQDLAELIRQSCAKDPRRRPSDARAFAADLGRILERMTPASAQPRPASRPATPVLVPTAVSEAKATVLVVEDDPLLLRIYCSALGKQGLASAPAGSGKAGLDRARQAPRPDAILLDLGLPDCDGLDVLAALRADPTTAMIPVMVFSNTLDAERIRAAEAAGAARVLSKANSSPAEIVRELRGVLAETSTQTMPTPSSPRTESGPRGSEREAAVDFTTAAMGALARLQLQLSLLGGTCTPRQRELALDEFAGTANGLAGAGAAGHPGPALLAEAMELLAGQLLETPERVTASTLHTLDQAVGVLCQRFAMGAGQPFSPEAQRTLVVDDDRISRRVVLQSLSRVRIPAEAYASPFEALEALKREKFGLVLSDVMMDGMDGIAFANELRALPGYQRVPVIFVTGLQDFEKAFPDFEAHHCDLVAKPFLVMEVAVKALVHLLS